MIIAYLDESYNQRTVCLGGWVAPDEVWRSIIHDLEQRVAYENRISALKGLRPISRYHAADCASRRSEFDGWSQHRQIRLAKKLLEILCKHQRRGLWGYGWGASVDDFREVVKATTLRQAQRYCYQLCADAFYKELCIASRFYAAGEEVRIVHDSGGLAAEAQTALRQFGGRDGRVFTFSSMPWQDAPALQFADLIAYEAMRLTDRRHQGDDALRKYIDRLIGKRIPGTFGYFPRGAFQYMRDHMPVQGGAPLEGES